MSLKNLKHFIQKVSEFYGVFYKIIKMNKEHGSYTRFANNIFELVD
jgi:hypothetical protein